jgi:hypothetical protein
MVAGGVEVTGDHQRSRLAPELLLDPAELCLPPSAVVPDRGEHVDVVEP